MGFFKALRVDSEKQHTQSVANLPMTIGSSKTWEERLKTIIDTPDKSEAREFLQETAKPALEEVRDEFIKNGLSAEIIQDHEKNKIHLHVGLGDEQDFIYGVIFIETITPDYAMSKNYYRAEVYLLEGGQDYDVIGWSKSALINDIIEQYRKHMHFLHKTR